MFCVSICAAILFLLFLNQCVCFFLLLHIFAFLCSVICHSIIIKKLLFFVNIQQESRGWHAAQCLGAFIHNLMFIVVWPLMKSGQPICGTQRYCQLKNVHFHKNSLHACNCYLRRSSLRTSS